MGTPGCRVASLPRGRTFGRLLWRRSRQVGSQSDEGDQLAVHAREQLVVEEHRHKLLREERVAPGGVQAILELGGRGEGRVVEQVRDQLAAFCLAERLEEDRRRFELVAPPAWARRPSLQVRTRPTFSVVTTTACSKTPTCFFMPVRVMWNFSARSVILKTSCMSELLKNAASGGVRECGERDLARQRTLW